MKILLLLSLLIPSASMASYLQEGQVENKSEVYLICKGGYLFAVARPAYTFDGRKHYGESISIVQVFESGYFDKSPSKPVVCGGGSK